MPADIDEHFSAHSRALDHFNLLVSTAPGTAAVPDARRRRGRNPRPSERRFQHKARDGSEEPSFGLAFLGEGGQGKHVLSYARARWRSGGASAGGVR